eukprot:3338939-Amphidinium_carterae.1
MCIRDSLSILARCLLTTSAWGCPTPKLLASMILKARFTCPCAEGRLPSRALAAAKLLSVVATSGPSSGCSGP